MRTTYAKKTRVLTLNLTPESKAKLKSVSVSASDCIEALIRAQIATGGYYYPGACPHYHGKTEATSIRLTTISAAWLSSVCVSGVSRADYLEHLVRNIPLSGDA